MADYYGINAISAASIAASSVDTVVLTGPTATGVTVLNATGTAAIYFTVCTVGGPNTQPTVGGTNCYQLPAAIGSLDVRVNSPNGVVVNLISSGTPGYAVEICR